MWGLALLSGIHPSGFVFLLRPLFGYAAYGANQVVLCCILMPDFGCVGFGAPGEELLCGLRSATACDHLGLPGRKYKVIQGQSLHVMDLEAPGRGHMVK